MTEPSFVRSKGSLTLGQVISLTGAEPSGGLRDSTPVTGVKPLDLAGPSDISFFDSPRFADAFRSTDAAACFVRRDHPSQSRVPLLIVNEPYRAFVTVARHLHEAELRPTSIFGARGVDSGAFVHPEARLEDGVIVDPGAVVGPDAEIGSGTIIGANATVGAGVRIGRDCSVGPGASVLNALIGDRVLIHAGARIGQDGFGFLPGKRGHEKIPQVGRVIVQDDVEIGANTTIDRGAVRDTMIGEGTKIDNLVQIGHNVSVGRHCIIVAQVGISGSVKLGDRVMLGGKVGVADHVTIGDGAQVAAGSGVISDIPAGARWMGYPARPHRQFLRETATVARLTDKGRNNDKPNRTTP